jgi:hypothetical protein
VAPGHIAAPSAPARVVRTAPHRAELPSCAAWPRDQSRTRTVSARSTSSTIHLANSGHNCRGRPRPIPSITTSSAPGMAAAGGSTAADVTHDVCGSVDGQDRGTQSTQTRGAGSGGERGDSLASHAQWVVTAVPGAGGDVGDAGSSTGDGSCGAAGVFVSDWNAQRGLPYPHWPATRGRSSRDVRMRRSRGDGAAGCGLGAGPASARIMPRAAGRWIRRRR